MAARSGPDHHHSGPHLPTAPAKLGPEDIGDPAKGEAVPRCLTCGVPGQRDNRLLEFVLLLVPGHLPAGWYRLCERCHFHANPRPPVDPLSVSEAA